MPVFHRARAGDERVAELDSRVMGRFAAVDAQRGVAQGRERQRQRDPRLVDVVYLRETDVEGAESRPVPSQRELLHRQFGALGVEDVEHRLGQRIEYDDAKLVVLGITLDVRGESGKGFDGEPLTDLFALAEAVDHVLGDAVDAAAADRVVGMILQQPPPSDVEEPARVLPAEHGVRYVAHRLGPVAQERLAAGVSLLERYPAGKDAGDQPLCIAVDAVERGFAEVALEDDFGLIGVPL